MRFPSPQTNFSPYIPLSAVRQAVACPLRPWESSHGRSQGFQAPQDLRSPTGVLPDPSDAIDGAHHQGFAAGQADVELVPSLASRDTDGTGHTAVAVAVGPGNAGSPELRLVRLVP